MNLGASKGPDPSLYCTPVSHNPGSRPVVEYETIIIFLVATKFLWVNRDVSAYKNFPSELRQWNSEVFQLPSKEVQRWWNMVHDALAIVALV